MASDGSALTGILEAAEQGATILTANQRTSRTLLDAYDRRQQQANVAAWRTADVLPWRAFLHRLWNDLVFTGLAGSTVLLNDAQERTLWQRIVTSETGDKLLNSTATAANAQQAWQLVRQYSVPLQSDLFRQRPETAAFFRWAAAFEAECRRNDWVDESSLPVLIVPQLRSGRISVRKRILLIGFDHFTPQQQSFIDALVAAGSRCESVQVLRGPAAAVSVAFAEDAADELRAAAAWAAQRLKANPDARIGIVSFGLADHSARIDRVFLEVLHPDQLAAGAVDRPRSYELSVGKPLSEAPVIATALLAVKLACTGLSLDEATSLIASPFTAGADAEMTTRARFDSELRKRRRLDLSLHQLREDAYRFHGCSVLLAALKAAERTWSALPSRQSPRQWAQDISTLLEVFGWPKRERGLTSAEFQAVEAWNKAMLQFGSLDPVEPFMESARFFAQLQQCVGEQLFAPEKAGAPIQIMGPLEAAGSHLDALWVLGMHDGVWPSGARPNPFIPLSLQLKFAVPHASAAIELQYAEIVRDRLLCSAAEVVFSWPKIDGDIVLRPSPMLSGLIAAAPEQNVWTVAGDAPPTWGSVLYHCTLLERMEDEIGPAVQEGTDARGGTAVLKSQAACPFMSFAQWRLGASEPESPTPGLDARQRGVIIHRAIEFVWKELKSHSELVRRRAEWNDIVDACVRQAIDDTDSAGVIDWERSLAEIEHARVGKLILELLDLETARAPFTVELEKDRTVSLGGLHFRMKLDRIDRLEDDLGCVLIDYKTGNANISSWVGDRPEEPQLPAYAATTDEKIAGVSFVKIRAGDVGFAGYSPERSILPDASDYGKTSPGKQGLMLDQVVSEWRRTVERLAQEHREGRAEADPVNGTKTCSICPVPALCRIAELRAASSEEVEDDADAQ